MNPITLLTDFGVADGYVGTMKGVILGIAPAAPIIDISHLISPQNIAEGAFVLSRAYRYFPRGTVHVVVIDPGVGGARRPVLLDAGHSVFIGPDNGVFSYVLTAETACAPITWTRRITGSRRSAPRSTGATSSPLAPRMWPAAWRPKNWAAPSPSTA
jgi:S-adenosylmethionine hydrolase